MKFTFKSLFLIIILISFSVACKKDKDSDTTTPVDKETCSDGIQNQGEEGVDCGGPCTACPPKPTCTDGIKNQGETGIDCGGPCKACDSFIQNYSFKVDGEDFQPIKEIVGGNTSGYVFITAIKSDTHYIMFDVPGDVAVGSYPINDVDDHFSFRFNVGDKTYYSMEGSGAVIISDHDLTQNIIKGTFEFKATDFSSDTVTISEGKFAVKYEVF